LREIGVANDLTRKVELLAGDGVGIMRRFDQRFDGRQAQVAADIRPDREVALTESVNPSES
jgi:hypothetical protein